MPRRRRFLHGTALALAAGLAGCSDDGGGDGEDGSDGEDGDDGTTTDGETDGETTEPAETTTEDGTMDGDATQVTVGPGGSLSFDPESVTVSVGETVQWTWDGSGHNIVVDSAPEESSWEGDPDDLYSSGHTHEHTFEVAGAYSYYCNPHRGSGMVGSITVEE